MSMNPRARFVRIVVASAVGSLLWAGCATNPEVIREPAGAGGKVTTSGRVIVTEGAPIFITNLPKAPIDLTKRRPDTTPELRLGLHPVTFYLPQTGYTLEEVYLVRSPRIVDPVTGVVSGDPGVVIVERAGAPAPAKSPKWWQRSSENEASPGPAIEAKPVTPIPTPAVPEFPLEEAEPGTIFQNNENSEEGPLLKLHVVRNKE
jgi:hypothetical protein